VFAAEAAAHPVAALFTFPVQIGAVRVATLDTYRATPGSLRPGELSTALRVADVAALALSGLRAGDGRWLDGDGRWMEGAGMRPPGEPKRLPLPDRRRVRGAELPARPHRLVVTAGLGQDR
jgi:hypothetical protein